MSTESTSTVYHKRRHAARTTDEYLFHQLVPYLGNKRRLLHLILEALEQTGTLNREDGRAPIFADFFCRLGCGVTFSTPKWLSCHCQ